MRNTSLALAAALVVTPAVAQEKSCDVIKEAHEWSIFTITETADTLKKQFCMSFASTDERVEGVAIKTGAGTGLSVISQEGCMDMAGSENQIITPIVSAKDKRIVELPPLGFSQAKDEYTAMSQICIEERVHPKGDKVNFKVPMP